MYTAPPAPQKEQFILNRPLHGPWPDVRLWGRRLPGPAFPASSNTIVAIAAGVLVAAISLPLDTPGVGWLITAVGVAIALLVARPGASPIPPLVTRPAERPGWDQLAWGVATIALVGVGTFRAAGWLFALCLVTATLTFALAIGAGRSMRAVVTTYLIAPVAVLRALPWLVRGLARMRRTGTGRPAPIRIAATAAVSIALLAIFGALFASADPDFANVLGALLPDITVSGTFRWIFICGLTAPVLSGAAYLRVAPPRLADLDRTEGHKVRRLEWAVPLTLLTLLFGAFISVQLTTVLFGGERHVLTTAGLTYAGYARGGFWQLSIVTGLTLVVLAGAARWAPREAPGDRATFRAVLGTLTLLTLLIVASALVRMQVYIDTYGLTRLRLLVACCELWFGVILLLVLVAGIRIRAPWLPRVAIAVGVLTLIGLAVANPDLRIAQNQLNRAADRIDPYYLATLSPDAVPALARMADPADRACVLHQIGLGLDEHEWREWNLGRAAARELIGESPRPADSDRCVEKRYGY
ncbi:DUF4153 domain-containing protein [Actinoplanes regularis]|uniref:DUF4153 domain-containing protein n=1 Tax=Actinoplanes regularis TaxID=52697 RepID=UPI0024A31685|nr:DUF4173 domain-containing protein [Actinoplanes regularis]GLW29984.1 hypothetical protein Areg01_29240 [Actinoplanes regularis]